MQVEALPELNSQTVAFLESPNAMLGAGPDRLRVARGRMGTEFFAYDTVRELLKNPLLTPRTDSYFREAGASELVQRYVRSGMLTVMPSIDHDRVKRVLVKGFAPNRVRAFGTMVRSVADTLIDQLGETGDINFVADFSHHFTITSIARFIGVPAEDVGRVEGYTVNFRLLGQVPIAPGLPKLEETIRAVSAYVQEIVAQRRHEPREDLLSDMVAAEAEGEKLTADELLWATTNLLNAGHDTTRFQLAACVHNLIRWGLWDSVAQDPSLCNAVIAETMRLNSVTPRQVRIPTVPMEIEGLPFAAGEVLVLNFAGAGRDPARFNDPDTMILNRANGYDIGFGVGGHFCLGHALAKLELVEALQALTQAWEPPVLTGPLEWKPTGVICGMEVVPISFRRRQPAAAAA